MRPEFVRPFPAFHIPANTIAAHHVSGVQTHKCVKVWTASTGLRPHCLIYSTCVRMCAGRCGDVDFKFRRTCIHTKRGLNNQGGPKQSGSNFEHQVVVDLSDSLTEDDRNRSPPNAGWQDPIRMKNMVAVRSGQYVGAPMIR